MTDSQTAIEAPTTPQAEAQSPKPAYSHQCCQTLDERWFMACASLVSLNTFIINPVPYSSLEYSARSFLKNVITGVDLSKKGSPPQDLSPLIKSLAAEISILYKLAGHQPDSVLAAVAPLPDGDVKTTVERLAAVRFLHPEPMQLDTFLFDFFSDPAERFRCRSIIDMLVEKRYFQTLNKEFTNHPVIDFSPALLPAFRRLFLRQSPQPIPSLRAKSSCRPVKIDSKRRQAIAARLDRSVAGLALPKAVLLHRGVSYLASGIPTKPLFLVGPTGSGKTHLVRSLATALNVPFSRIDLSRVTASGYRGQDLPDAYQRALASSRKNPFRMVIMLDEFDKIAAVEDTYNRDIRGVEVQHELLSLLEQTAPESPQPLLLLAGAFSRGKGLETARPQKRRSIGFVEKPATEEPDADSDSVYAALERAGILPEILGRLGQVIRLPRLDQRQYLAILEGESSPLREYARRFAEIGKKLVVTKHGLQRLATASERLGLGARGISHVLDALLSASLNRKSPTVRLTDIA